MLTLDQLKNMSPDTAFATGECVNSIHGINMENKYQGRILRWVAVRGGIHDWCIVCDWADEKSVEEVKQHGQKIVNKKYILALVPATEEAMNWYRM